MLDYCLERLLVIGFEIRNRYVNGDAIYIDCNKFIGGVRNEMKLIYAIIYEYVI